MRLRGNGKFMTDMFVVRLASATQGLDLGRHVFKDARSPHGSFGLVRLLH